MSSLVSLPTGSCGVIKNVCGGKCARQKLTSMGVVRDSTVRVIKNDKGGPLILGLGEGRLVLGRGIANKVMIEEN